MMLTGQRKLKVGDKVYSGFFKCLITIAAIDSDKDWWFSLPSGQTMKAKTSLSYFEKQMI